MPCHVRAVDGDEITLLCRLLTDIYPNTSFSAVLDSYTIDGGFKKSQKGCCVAARDSIGKLVYVDGRTWTEAQVSGIDAECNLLKTIFVDGKMIKETDIIRREKHFTS